MGTRRNSDPGSHALSGPVRADLTRGLANGLDPGLVRRGVAYYIEGRVRILDIDPDGSVFAEVRGSRVYDVEIRPGGPDGAGMTSWCDCPRFGERGACKHVFATVLAVEEGVRLHEIGAARPARDSPSPAEPALVPWRRALDDLGDPPAEAIPIRPEEQVLYVIGLEETLARGRLHLALATRRRLKRGDWGALRSTSRRNLPPEDPRLDEHDQRVLAVLAGCDADDPYDRYGYRYGYGSSLVRVPTPLLGTLVPLLARTGRLRLARSLDLRSPDPGESLAWDEGPPWRLVLEVVPAPGGHRCYAGRGFLLRGEERMEIAEPALLLAGGFVLARGAVARLDDAGAFGWIATLRRTGPLRIPARDLDECLTRIYGAPAAPPVVLPEELGVEEARAPPRPRLRIARTRRPWMRRDRLEATVSFDYLGEVVPGLPPGRAVWLADRRTVVWRDPDAERAAFARLAELSLKPADRHDRRCRTLTLTPKRLPGVVRALVGEGWHVEAEGKIYRSAGAFGVSVRSGIDWFELHGALDFDGGAAAPLPALLAALRRKERTVVLDDGSLGLLPEEWLERWGFLAKSGSVEDGHLRFDLSQTAMLDALLAARPEATFDEAFRRAREELARFESLEPADPPPTFAGELRGYQRTGLGWLHLLRRFGLSGCLADDMGLGKTVQVLALLEARRVERESAGGDPGGDPGADPRPSLVVVPKSLLFNWRREAERFAPRLEVLTHAGPNRAKEPDALGDADLVLTTYGTLRRDAAFLKDRPFDYVVLDEAQAIKNAATATAKAARLLDGRHRLALSGTPVENHLGELWSLVEFLNPGMLGTARVFRDAFGGNGDVDPESREILARALRPILLRRTKEEVAPELPPRTEQTIWCDLDAKQCRQYAELRDHYRAALLRRVDEAGMNRSKIQVLEALLRLRQAACHPGLLDAGRAGEGSAKLSELFPRLAELTETGHKVLVFSQFTTFLGIVRRRLDREGTPYAYLDGKTRDREARVARFQEDPDCRLFLVSLKAGGLGLNLTAADYVFLLDPWWNPAVEAQALDRTHRIGQTRHVFAYRLIARDTVEEKVLALQETKRELADAILGAGGAPLRDLTREDLELLLG